MSIEKSKLIGGGDKVKIEGWHDDIYGRELFQVVIETPDGGSVSLPRNVKDGTREKVERIFDAISTEDSHETLWGKLDKLDKL